jgi:hypothetical protein
VWLLKKKNEGKDKAADIAMADRTERFEIYKLMVEMADRVSQRRQAANSFYLSINTFLITASAYIGTTEASARVTLLVCCAGVLISVLWTKAIESYKSLNENKFAIINALETKLIAQPYSDEWTRIDPSIHGKKHRPFHQTERVVPKVFTALFVLQALSILPWKSIMCSVLLLIYGGMD